MVAKAEFVDDQVTVALSQGLPAASYTVAVKGVFSPARTDPSEGATTTSAARQRPRA